MFFVISNSYFLEFPTDFLTTGSTPMRGHDHALIVEVCLAELNHQLSFIAPDGHTRLTRIAAEYLMGRIPYGDAAAAFTSIAGSCEPVNRLHSILSIPEAPIDPSEDKERSPRRRMKMWSPYEDTRLLAGIYRYGMNNWAPISRFVGNSRTRAQCAQRWARGLNPRIRKSSWDPTEEVRLVQLVATFGEKAWTKVSESLGNRSDVQCRYHYYQLLKDMPHFVRTTAMGSFPKLGDGTMPIGLPVKPVFQSGQTGRFSVPILREPIIDGVVRRRGSQLVIGPGPIPEEDPEESGTTPSDFLSIANLLNPPH
jgi:hypothetical protein